MEQQILVINGGSSSIKFAVHAREGLKRLLSGSIERIALPGTTLSFTDGSGKTEGRMLEVGDRIGAIDALLSFLAERPEAKGISAIGHRIVHGMDHREHVRITSELMTELRARETLDPEHLPLENAIIDACQARYPEIPEVACFDTVFHKDLPRVAKTLPIPRRFEAKGIRRYGFHGLSCGYVLEELRRTDPSLADGRIIIAHLGSGASITAVRAGSSVDTSMGFTPAGGIPMSSRTGDIDPGTFLQMARIEGLTTEDMMTLVSHASGLLGVSETTADMHDLLTKEHDDPRAKEAIDLFCYEAKKRIAGYAGVLGGVDALVFTGGIGERSENIRSRICEGLEWMGIDKAHVRVIHTDEELMIARIVATLA
jgi:acetate kinase